MFPARRSRKSEIRRRLAILINHPAEVDDPSADTERSPKNHRGTSCRSGQSPIASLVNRIRRRIFGDYARKLRNDAYKRRDTVRCHRQDKTRARLKRPSINPPRTHRFLPELSPALFLKPSPIQSRSHFVSVVMLARSTCGLITSWLREHHFGPERGN